MKNAKLRVTIGALLTACAIGPPAIAATANAEPAPQQRANPDAGVFAIVNGTTISAQEYATAVSAGARNKYYHKEPPEAEFLAFKHEIADKLVNRILLLAEVKRRGLAPDHDKIRETLAGYERQYKDSPRWQQQRGEMLPRVQRELEQQSMLERLERDVRDVRTPADSEVRAYYRAQPALFTEPEQVRLAVILLKVDPSSPKLAWDKARDEARAIGKRLAGGADFAELARLHSGDPSAQNGGDMGYVHRGMLPQAVQDELDKMKSGMTSDPVTLLDGVALMRLTDRKIARLRVYDEVQKRAADLLQREQADKNWKEFIAALRSRAVIKIDLERYPELRESDTEKRKQAIR